MDMDSAKIEVQDETRPAGRQAKTLQEQGWCEPSHQSDGDSQVVQESVRGDCAR